MKFVFSLFISSIAVLGAPEIKHTLSLASTEVAVDCLTCAGQVGVDLKTIEECLAKVPNTCEYTLSRSVNGEAESTAICPSSFGAKLEDLKTSIGSSDSFTSGSVELSLTVEDDCRLDVYLSNKEECATTPSDGLVVEGASATSQKLVVELTSIPTTQTNLNLAQAAGTCGSKISKVAYKEVVATYKVKGTATTSGSLPTLTLGLAGALLFHVSH